MKSFLIAFSLLAATAVQAQKTVPVQVPGYPISPVPFTQVKVGDGFWGQRENLRSGWQPQTHHTSHKW